LKKTSVFEEMVNVTTSMAKLFESLTKVLTHLVTHLSDLEERIEKMESK
jgi:hypothetical protein